jgi:hypothetical protein
MPNNNNNNNTAAEPPGEGGNSGGDIEQGRSSPSPSWVAAVISDHTTTPTTISSMTTRPGSRRLEHVDVEEAAPVPLVQQIADMEIEKCRNIINSEGVSTTPQQGAMEQVEEGDDAAPRPFNSAEFEDHDPKPKVDLGEESIDEDDGPPLPLNYAEFEDESKPKLDLGEESTDEDGPPLPYTYSQQRDSLSICPSHQKVSWLVPMWAFVKV